MLEQVAFVRVGPRILGGRLSTALELSDIVGKERTMLTWPLVGSPGQDRSLVLREGGPVGFQWLWGAYRRLSVRRDKRDGSIPITTQRGKGGDICGMVGGPGRVVPRDSRSRGNPGLFRRVVPAFFASHDLPGAVQDGLYVPVDHLPVVLYPGDRHLGRALFPAPRYCRYMLPSKDGSKSRPGLPPAFRPSGC